MNSLPIVAVGGKGGGGAYGSNGGFGARIAWTMPVGPGQVYYLVVGGNGQGYDRNNNNSGGGGAGGGNAGSAGTDTPAEVGVPTPPRATGGKAGIPEGTGAGGTYAPDPGGGPSQAQAGSPGIGGRGGLGNLPNANVGGFNGGGAGGNSQVFEPSVPGGGGGGFHGGGGGASTNSLVSGGAGGGGGSSLVPVGATKTVDVTGQPQLQITYPDNGGPVVTLAAVPQWINEGHTFHGTAGTQLGDGPVSLTIYEGPVEGGDAKASGSGWPDTAS